jgi:flagellar basal-body rod protein FlgC
MVNPIMETTAQKIAVSGIRAQRVRMNFIANNIANAETTRTPDGKGAFRRQLVVLASGQLKPGTQSDKVGVRVQKIVKDTAPLRQVYDPSHPDANAQGYVQYPNVNMAVEMADLISAQRAYEANIAVLTAGTRMSQRAAEIIQK